MTDDLSCYKTDINCEDDSAINNFDQENNLNRANNPIRDEIISSGLVVKRANPESDDEIRKATSGDMESRPHEISVPMAAARDARCRQNFAEEIHSFRSQGIDFYLQLQYARAKTCFESALKLAMKSRKRMNSAMKLPHHVETPSVLELPQAHGATYSLDASVARLQAFVSLMSFLLAIKEKKLLTSRDFQLRNSTSGASDAARTILEHRFERRLLEAYEAGCAAVETVEKVAAENGGSEGDEDEDAMQRIVSLDASEKRALDKLPSRVRRPNEVVSFDRRRDERQEKLENAKKMLRKFLMFHHAMGMDGP